MAADVKGTEGIAGVPPVNTAEEALSGPAKVNTTYDFGDWITGRSYNKQMAANQANADYVSWVRSEASARYQREWEEYMASTQAQRAMKDLEAAGLNPILAVQGAGFGQSTPVGSSGSSSAGHIASGGSSSTGAAFGSAAAGIALLIKTIAKVLK